MFLKNKWWAIAESKTIRNCPVALRRLGEDLVLWRDNNGQIVCQSSQCPHRGANLALGRVVEGCLECPYHGFRFAPEGHCSLMPCEGKSAVISPEMRVTTYKVEEARDLIWLWWGEEQVEYPPIPWFEQLKSDRPIRWASGIMTWNVPFTRAAESLLIDLHHFAFLHRKMAKLSGLGDNTRLDPFEAKVEGDTIYTSGKLRSEKGDKQSVTFKHWLHFPSLALFDLGIGNINLFVAATPIDEENTWAYARYYAHYSIPAIDRLIAKLATWVEFTFVQPDDYKIIRSSKPQHSSLIANRFVPADKAIVLWHKLYQSQLNL